MRMRALVFALLAAAATVIVGVTGAASAQAAICGYTQGANNVVAATPYTSTGYGNVAVAVQYNANGTSAKAGFYSGANGTFSATTGSYSVSVVGVLTAGTYTVADGEPYAYETCAVGDLNTPYGRVAYGSQYYGNQVRWGNYNYATQKFYPDGGWRPRA